MAEQLKLSIPKDLLPKDGRFGSGPSKIRQEAVQALADIAPKYLGTSHRQPMVKDTVGRLRSGLRQLFSLPDGYEVLLSNGGSTYFWDVATFSLIRSKSQHLSFGEFSSKFAAAAQNAPHLMDPQIIKAEVGSHPSAITAADVDLYALTQNETSTGVAMEIVRPAGSEGLVAVDATSGAGGLHVDASQFDCYYFAPQKCFASDGGLWIALFSPAGIARIEEISASERWIPASMDLSIVLENSRLNQTYNTPALATIYLFVNQIEWMLENGGLEFAVKRSQTSATHLYGWAENSQFATPFVKNPAMRSSVVGTIDFDESIDAMAVAKILRQNGVIDTEPYRKLGRNQLRIAMFPGIDPDDVAALCDCVDFIVKSIS